MPPRRRTETGSLAERLLEAQVEFVLSELTGDRLREVIDRDVQDLLTLAGTLRLADVLDAETVTAFLRRAVATVRDAPGSAELAGELADAVYDLDAGDDHLLGEFLDRDAVDALIVKVLGLSQLHDAALERLSQSPLMGTVAAGFVTRIVTDVVAQNRARAERLPGMRSMISLGTSAANRIKSPFDKQLDALLGDATDRGTQAAVRRTTGAMRDVMRDAPLHDAALEIWDLHANEPVSALRVYVSRQDLHELVDLTLAVASDASRSPFADALLAIVVETLFARYGSRDVADVLADLGLTAEVIVTELQALLPPLIEAARTDGGLAEQIRRRLAPFWSSDAVAALLAEDR